MRRCDRAIQCVDQRHIRACFSATLALYSSKMCYVLYIGAKNALPEIAPQDFTLIDTTDEQWPEKAVAFSVTRLSEFEEPSRKHFRESCVMNAGSFEGCGCGFNGCVIREWEEPKPPSAHELAGRRSREKLTEYVKANKVTSLYGCWSGDESLPLVGHESISIARLSDLSFEFPERVMLSLELSPSSSPSPSTRNSPAQ